MTSDLSSFIYFVSVRLYDVCEQFTIAEMMDYPIVSNLRSSN